MSIAIQQRPIALETCGHLAQPPIDIKPKIDDAIRQMIMQLLDEIMKDPQVMQGLNNLLQNMGGGGGGDSQIPEPQAAFSTSKPTAQNPGQPQGQGAPEGAGGGGGEPATAQAPTGGNTPTPTPTPEAPPASKPAAESQSTSGPGSVTADPGKGPAGMPAELWKGCVETAEKTGVDPFVLAAQMEKESQFGKALAGSPSAGDGLMQVEPSTREAYAAKFEAKMGHAYDHANQKDQIAMAGVILADKGGDTQNMLQKYNGGDNWVPGTTDSYGREIKAQEYAATVMARAEAMKS